MISKDPVQALSTWEKVGRALKVVEIAILVFGAVLGYKAYEVYKTQAAISVVNRLDEAEEHISDAAIKDPLVNSMFGDVKNGVSPKEEADRYLEMLAGCTYKGSHKCTADQGALPVWRTIPELDCAMWEAGDFSTPTKMRLRQGFNEAEAILYLVARAYEYQYERKVDIGDEEYGTRAAYVGDRGHHPLFLTAFRYGRLHGFLTDGAVTQIVKLLNKSDRARKMAQAIYPGYETEVTGSGKGLNGCP